MTYFITNQIILIKVFKAFYIICMQYFNLMQLKVTLLGQKRAQKCHLPDAQWLPNILPVKFRSYQKTGFV